MDRPAPLGLALAAALALVACNLVACKENGNDYLDRGLRLLGEAERGDCKAGWDGSKSQSTIDSRIVAQCLDKTKLALEQLHKARELGVQGREAENLIQKTEAEVAKLESMLRVVGRLQNERHLD